MSQCLSGDRTHGRLILGGRQRPDNVCLGMASASCGKRQVSALGKDRISPLINMRRLYGEWSYQRSGDRSESSRGVGANENQSWDGVGNDVSLFCHCKRIVWIRHFQSQAFISHSCGWRDQDQDVGSFGAWWGLVSAFQMAALFLCHHMVAGLKGGQLSSFSSLGRELSHHHHFTCQRQCPPSDPTAWESGAAHAFEWICQLSNSGRGDGGMAVEETLNRWVGVMACFREWEVAHIVCIVPCVPQFFLYFLFLLKTIFWGFYIWVSYSYQFPPFPPFNASNVFSPSQIYSLLFLKWYESYSFIKVE